MDYDSFRKSAVYGCAPDSTKIIVAMHLLDPENKGITKSQLENTLQQDIGSDRLSQLIENMSYVGQISAGNGVYQLDNLMRRSATLIIELSNAQYENRPVQDYCCVPKRYIKRTILGKHCQKG